MTDCHNMRRLEAGLAFVDIDVRVLTEAAFRALLRWPLYRVLTRLHLLHVDLDIADVDAELRGAASHVGHAGAGHQGLGGDAASVDAGPAKQAALDDGDFAASLCHSYC